MTNLRLPAYASMLAALAALAGCAAPPPPPPPASETASIDGTYKGTGTGSCGVTQASADLLDGRFTLTLGNGETVAGKAHANGSLEGAGTSAMSRDMNFSGHIDGKDMRGGSYNGRCAFAFSLTRQS